MPQNTNLNVTPYYDDFDKDKNFYKVLFRPGFPIQARELTTIQSILQNQVESIGTHLFKEGAMVIPGQVGYDSNIDCILLQASFLGADVELYREQLTGKIITGFDNGVKAKVLYSISAKESERGYITLYVKYVQNGGVESTIRTFINNEQLSCNSDITFGTTLIESGSAFAQLLPSSALSVGSAAYIASGVYFIRGHFVDVPAEYILLDQYGNNPTYRIGLQVTESIITSEDDDSLNDNAAGSSNYSAPGAHRFKISTKLVKKTFEDESDKNFVELLRLNNSRIQKFVTRTALGELEKSLALRTFQTNGNYVMRNYSIVVRDQLNDDAKSGINGVYESGSITKSGLVASDDYYTAEISPGVAYVNGFQIETITPQFIDFPKPRDTKALQNQIVPFEVGNSLLVTNIYGFPNFTGSSSVGNAYQALELYEKKTSGANYSTINGSLIGYARALTMEHVDLGAGGTYGGGDDIYQLNIFDIEMVTIIQISAATSVLQGSQIVGGTSGARCFVIANQTSATHLKVYQVEGSFRTGETIFVDGISKGTISNIHTYEFSDTRAFVAKDETTSSTEFTANIILDDFLTCDGDTFTYDSSAGTLTGFNTNYAKDLRPGDLLYFSGSDYLIVDYITPTNLTTGGIDDIFNYTTQVAKVIAGAGTVTSGTYTTVVRSRSQLQNQENNDLFIPMPKKYVKSVSDESMTVRRTYDSLTVPAGSLTVDLGGDEQFESIEDESFQLTVLSSTNGTYPVGSQIRLVTGSSNSSTVGYSTFTSADRTTLNISNLTNITSVKLTATISKNVVNKKLKTLSKMFLLKVNKTVENKDTQQYGLTYSNLYGTRIQDSEISLGVTDGFQLHAVYESLDDNDPVIPTITISELAFFAPGTFITGKTSSAKAKVVSFSTTTLKVSYIAVSGVFIPGEQITGFDNNGDAITALITDDSTSITSGSKVVTDDYYMELNQTGFFYNTSKLVRKSGRKPAIRKLLVVFDWFQHSPTGDYFTGQSYSGLSYYDIPFFNQSLCLTDFLDFRPSVKNLYSGGGTVTSPAYVACSTLDFKSRLYSSGATVIDVPKLNSNFRCDFDFYLPRVDKLFVSSEGGFQIVRGKSSEVPEVPEDIQNAMLLATFRMRPYGFDPEKDVVITKEDNRRYTMRDIGSIDRRLSNVEYYTSLSLLESETANTKIVDATGKDRLKNGFIVDDFASHDKSDTSNTDYRASLDYKNGHCRAVHYTTNVSLEWNTASSQNVQQTGPLVTLPYDEELIISQPYASRVVNVNPFNVFTYIGRIDLTPATDDWIDTKREPAKITQIEGNYEATRKEMNVDQNGFAPIQWGAWQTSWVGEKVTSTKTVYQPDWVASDVGKSPAPWVWGGKGLRRINEVDTIEVTTKSTRAGTRSKVVPKIENQSLGDSLLSSTVVPWIRSRNVQMYVARVKPRTRFYAFFDNVAFTNYMVPKVIELVKDTALDSRTNATPFVVGEVVVGQTSGCKLIVAAPNDGYKYNPYDDTEMPESYSSTTSFLNIDTEAMAKTVNGAAYGNIQVGEVLIGKSGAKAVVKDRRLVSDRSGDLKAVMWIPDPNIDTNPRWGTGKRTVRLTTSDTDSRLAGAVSSSAETWYLATGILNTVQENILAVRNADIVVDTVTDEKVELSTREETRQVGWYDPLAQSFIIDKPGGCFLTSVDVYFFTKDSAIPISCQIRAMENGYPSKRILPFSDITVNPSDVQLSENASIPTKFTFRSPVYLQSSVEYCFVLLSDSNEYQVWVSRMGENDITNNRTISEQPYAGVLFKSQNASTWTADQYEDLKFTAYLAKFNIGQQSKMIFNNTELALGNRGILNLRDNPVITQKPDQYLVLSAANVPFTIGATVQWINGANTYVATGTVKDVYEAATGTILVVTDLSGALTQVGTSRWASSRTIASIEVSANTTNFTVGNFIKHNNNDIVGQITAWNSGTSILTVNYISPNSSGTVFQANDTIKEYSSITSTTVIQTATIDDIDYSGDIVNSSTSAYIPYTVVSKQPDTNQRYVTIRHSNHCMHDIRNNVRISGVTSEVPPTYLTGSVGAADLSISVDDASSFNSIVNGLPIGVTNPGYLKIISSAVVGALPGLPVTDSNEFVDEEIIQYTAISEDGGTITLQNRTNGKSFTEGSIVECYNLDGIPLTLINKDHTEIESPTLDTYRIETGVVATDGIVGGGSYATATQNIQFDVLTTQFAKVSFPETSISGRAQIITGTSIGDGSVVTDQDSFVNDGQFFDISLDESNYLDSPRMVASAINEANELDGNKSLRIELTLDSTKPYISPYIDLDRTSLITTMNRINNPSNVNEALKAFGDIHEAVYITKIATLANNSGAIKINFAAYRPEDTEILVLYRVRPVGSTTPIQQIDYSFFPDDLASVPATSRLERYLDYSYEVQGLKFDQYQIKIVMRSPSQSRVPILSDFRAIALAI